MKTRVSVLGATMGVLLLGGCANSDSRSPVNGPAMPTIRAASAQPAVPLAEADKIDAALRAARANDFQAAAQTVVVGTDSMERARLARGVTTALAMDDPARAAEFAVAVAAGGTQLNAVEIAARAWVRRDADAALRWAVGLSNVSIGMTARRAVGEDMAAQNPRDAIERILAFPVTTARDEVIGFAVAAWARRDADAAIGWVRDLGDGELKARMISTASFEIAQTNPERAVALTEMLPAGRNRWLLLGAVAQTWVAKDAQAAMAWAKGLPAGEAREAAFAGFDTGLGLPSSRRIARAPGVRSGASRTRGGVAAATALRTGDTPSFELWLSSQRPGMSREEAILEYVRQRAAGEPAAIGQWLTTLPPSAARDQAMRAYVDNVLTTSPRDAANFLRSLPRSDLTPELMERTARHLLLTDPVAAEAWINQSGLPEFKKQELLREARR